MSETDRTNGRVKWFNNKSGFGFITVCDGDHAGQDIFVHHTAITVTGEVFKYLVEGEYVEFTLNEVSEGDHKWQALNVSGVNGWRLMCETRHLTRAEHPERAERTEQRSTNSRGGGRVRGRHTGGPRRYGGARDDTEEMHSLLRRIKQMDIPL